MPKLLICVALILGVVQLIKAQCDQASATTASGSHAPNGRICPGQLIFEDNFDSLDQSKWNHDQGNTGAGNNEFEWYVNSRDNSFARDSKLFLKPSIDESQGSWPIRSARLVSADSFSFKYGTIEVSAKGPTGDWLWPAIWLMPRWSTYGGWPASGEIDMMESRGNERLTSNTGQQIGTDLMGSTLHWGPAWNVNKYMLTHWERRNEGGWNTGFHRYQLEWTPDHITFKVDDQPFGTVSPPAGGFWEMGQLGQSGFPNPWQSGTKMAPFDDQFFLILNLAVGGTAYFPDNVNNPGGKPWNNGEGADNARADFWRGKDQWLPTWQLNTDNAALQIDYVRVWAL